jgi:GntR family transcriptional regulator
MTNGQFRFRIDAKAPEPAHRQISDQIRHWLVAGTLGPGDTLPSVRRLAIELMVHHNTVAEAYRTLAEEGWLDLSQGKAARVRARSARLPKDIEAREELQESFARRLQRLIAEMRASGLPERWIAAELAAQNLAARSGKQE